MQEDQRPLLEEEKAQQSYAEHIYILFNLPYMNPKDVIHPYIQHQFKKHPNASIISVDKSDFDASGRFIGAEKNPDKFKALVDANPGVKIKLLGHSIVGNRATHLASFDEHERYSVKQIADIIKVAKKLSVDKREIAGDHIPQSQAMISVLACEVAKEDEQGKSFNTELFDQLHNKGARVYPCYIKGSKAYLTYHSERKLLVPLEEAKKLGRLDLIAKYVFWTTVSLGLSLMLTSLVLLVLGKISLSLLITLYAIGAGLAFLGLGAIGVYHLYEKAIHKPLLQAGNAIQKEVLKPRKEEGKFVLYKEKPTPKDKHDILRLSPVEFKSPHRKPAPISSPSAPPADLKSQGDKKGTSLHLAAQDGNTLEAKGLLERRADLNQTDKYGRKPLHLAAENGHTAIVQMLLERRANPEPRDQSGLTPLHSAAYCGHTDIVNMLLERGAKPDQDSKYGWRPLHGAIQNGHAAIVKILLEKSADPNKADAKEGSRPLDQAVRNRDTASVEALLKKRANPNLAGKDGLTPLAWAVRSNHGEIRTLLEKAMSEDNKSSGPSPAKLPQQQLTGTPPEFFIRQRKQPPLKLQSKARATKKKTPPTGKAIQ